jgi:hypothetical protein
MPTVACEGRRPAVPARPRAVQKTAPMPAVLRRHAVLATSRKVIRSGARSSVVVSHAARQRPTSVARQRHVSRQEAPRPEPAGRPLAVPPNAAGRQRPWGACRPPAPHEGTRDATPERTPVLTPGQHAENGCPRTQRTESWQTPPVAAGCSPEDRASPASVARPSAACRAPPRSPPVGRQRRRDTEVPQTERWRPSAAPGDCRGRSSTPPAVGQRQARRSRQG